MSYNRHHSAYGAHALLIEFWKYSDFDNKFVVAMSYYRC